MFKLLGKDIVITRGDTGMLKLSVQLDGTDLKPSDYTAVLSVKRNIDDEDYIITKKASQDGELFFSHDDTKDLDVKTYVYDIEIRKDDQVCTIGPAKFKVEGDVTR